MNAAQSFPFEFLASHMIRNNANYHAVFEALQEWNTTSFASVDVTLTTETEPYFVTYTIPSKNAIISGSVMSGGIEYSTTPTIQQPNSVNAFVAVNAMPGDMVSYAIEFFGFGGTDWNMVVQYVDLSTQVVSTFSASTGISTYSNTFQASGIKVIKGVYITPLNQSIGASLKVVYSIKESLPNTPYVRSTGFYQTSNFRQWPFDQSSIWNATNYATDTTIPQSQAQKYSASMIFDHTNSNTKTINFIKYDGPDLDQGLCIYMPVKSNGTKPTDAYTLEFHISIYPTLGYTGNQVQDLVFNKNQVYFYSIGNLDCMQSAEPSMKIGMGRTCNYQVTTANITIPQKPTNWYVKFQYSTQMDQWVLVNINQLDDHVLIGSVGFVDPANGNQTVGYETTNLPTYQDPFGAQTLVRATASNSPWWTAIS